MPPLPESDPDILEWSAVLAHLAGRCQTGYGRALVTSETLVLPDVEAVRHEMNRVEEAKRLIQRYGDITLNEPPEVMPIIRRLQKQGDVQSPGELADLLNTLKTMRQIARFFIQHRSREEAPVLLPEIEAIMLPNPVIEQLEALVSENGELLDAASEAYGRLRQRVRETEASVKSTLNGMIHRAGIAKYLQEAIVTVRDGRSVLPVKSEHKVDVPGIVHGASATGVTLYIEPRAVVDLNNRLASLQADLEREIRRILREVSQALYPEVEVLETFLGQAAQLDLLLAKARQSLIFKANPVDVLEEAGRIHLRQARHPLLLLQLENVVPNDVFLAPPEQVLLITGPNTGGKTVLLKLIGLIALMVRSGLHVPVAEGSAMSRFTNVLADIGDAQSLSQNLSTFSGHIRRLQDFLNTPDMPHALVLVDEICAGTDPQEGAALAKALLETFRRQGATTVVTTHIGELKVFAHGRPGYLNASVEFDIESLSPTYRLILGVPGTSNALNIALHLGLAGDIVDRARAYLTQPVADSVELIESLERKNRQLTEELETARRLREEIQWEEQQMRKQLDRIEGEKQKTVQQYRDTLRNKLRGIEQEVEELKQQVRRPRKRVRPGEVQRLAGRFNQARSESAGVFREESEKLYAHTGLTWDSLKVGDTVSLRSVGMTGTIVEKHDAKQEVTLQNGILKTTVSFKDISQKVGQAAPSGKRKRGMSAVEPGKHRRNADYSPKPASWNVVCDVRGLTSEDAIGILEKFLDDALLSGAETLDVIHGEGTGALKKAIRAYLKTLPFVKRFGPAQAVEGGDGKTIVTL